MRKRHFVTLAVVLVTVLGMSDPGQSADGRPLLDLPLREPGPGTWQIRWSSVAGRPYLLQRSHDLAEWSDVLAVTADGPTTGVMDPGVGEDRRTFWRVIQLGDSPDLTPPTLSMMQVRVVEVDGQPALELSVVAEDDVGVVRTEFSEAGSDWIEATPGLERRYMARFGFDALSQEPRQFQARATDSAGNIGFSEVITFVPAPPAPGLVAVDVGGNTLSQGFIGQRADGSLTPFVYAPDHRGGALPESSPQLVFPEGGRIVQQDGRVFVEYRSLRFRFGRRSALQIARPGTGMPGAVGLAHGGPRPAS